MKTAISIRKILLSILLLTLALLFLAPLLWMISSSLKTPMQVFESPFRWVADKLRWENYVEVWTSTDIPFANMFLNSIIVSVATVIGQIFISSLAAYAFAKIPFKGRNLIFMLMLTTMMIPVQALIIPRFMVFHQLNLYDTLWCIIIPGLFSATTIFLLRQFYMSIPNDIVEAALIDGAGHLRIFAEIMMPLTKNGMISAAILTFITSWNEYLSPLVFLPSLERFTVSLGIRWYLNDTATEYNLMMCAAASAVIPIIIIYILAQNYFEDSIAAAGVKG